MLPLLAAALPAVLAGASSALGQRSANRTNVRLARESMAFEGDQAAKQMQFQERMSGSAYQRSVEDMRLAGINPMLAYAQGGASTPGGAAASGAQATVEDVAGPAVASAQHARRLQMELKQMRASTALTEGTTARQGFENALTEQQNRLAYQQTRVGEASERNIEAQTAATIAGMPSIRGWSARAGVTTPAFDYAGQLSRRLFSQRPGLDVKRGSFGLQRLGIR